MGQPWLTQQSTSACYSKQYIAEMVQSLRWQLSNLTEIGFGPTQQPHVQYVAYG